MKYSYDAIPCFYLKKKLFFYKVGWVEGRGEGVTVMVHTEPRTYS